MRSAPWELARRIARTARPRPDVLWVSDYVDLPALLGSLPHDWADLPTIAYFHENQLTYPLVGGHGERDGHPAWTNLTTLLRADVAVFNSRFHLRDLRRAADELLAMLPKPNPRAEVRAAFDDARVAPPGIEWDAIPLGTGGDGPLRVLFPHRWEHDKDPLAFLRAAREVVDAGGALELVLLGERSGRLPEGVGDELDALRAHVAHAGFVDSFDDYARMLGTCDVVASTATHEFFGIAVCEALAAGCLPLLPNRLAYPEVLDVAGRPDGLYEDGALASRLLGLARDPGPARDPDGRAALRAAMRGFDRGVTADRLDTIAEQLAPRAHAPTTEA